jgi:hypothetical protein
LRKKGKRLGGEDQWLKIHGNTLHSSSEKPKELSLPSPGIHHLQEIHLTRSIPRPHPLRFCLLLTLLHPVVTKIWVDIVHLHSLTMNYEKGCIFRDYILKFYLIHLELNPALWQIWTKILLHWKLFLTAWKFWMCLPRLERGTSPKKSPLWLAEDSSPCE